jgi:hypothetical protein
MQMCAFCGAETQLYHRDVPVCLDCSMICEQTAEPKLVEVQERPGRRPTGPAKSLRV